MKTKLLSLLIVFASAAFGQKYLDMIDKGTFTVEQIETSAEKYFDTAGRGRGTGYKQFRRWLYQANRSRKNDGVLISTNEQFRNLRKYKQLQKSKEKPDFVSTANWTDLGPDYWNATSGWNPGVGRITSIGIHPTDLNTYIVGGPNCGVWKTTNNGGTWLNTTDGFQDLNVWALEINPNNANQYWWGSNNGDVFVSNNAGQTWQEISFPGSSTIERILIHPTDVNTVFISSGGLYKTTNGGASWSLVAPSTRGYDIEFKPGDPSVVYFSGDRVYKSTNGGDSFTELNGGFSSSQTKMMAVTAANPNILYVVEELNRQFGGLFKSTNSGASFSKIQSSTGASNNYFGYDAAGNDDRGQAPRDMDITVNPNDANEIIIGGIQTWKSTNGGSSFNLNSYWTPSGASSRNVGYIHADVDILKWKGNKVFAGTDGGIYTSTNSGASYTDKTTGISCREFYRIGVSKTDPNVVSGGSQDNGTSVMRGNGRNWFCWLGADGMETFVDWSNSSKLYGTSQFGSMYKSTNQGNSRSGISKPSGVGNGSWVTPFEQDPQNASTIYVGFKEVFKSTNEGGSWTAISSFGGGNLDELKIAPSNNNYIYAADGSTLRRTKNGGGSWSTISPGGDINYIHVSPRSHERVVVVTNNTIWVSVNAGDSWSNITLDLPNVTYECAVWADNAENGLYVGGLGFVSYIESGMNSWINFGEGLPMCKVSELEINYVSNTIFAGTYGRGLWESDLYAPIAVNYDVVAESLTQVPSSLCGNQISPQLTIRNAGDQVLTFVKIDVFLNDVLVETINHATNLVTGATENITLSNVIYTAEGNNDLKIVLREPNNQADEKLSNNELIESTQVAFGDPHVFYIDQRSASTGFAWEIKDGATTVRLGDYNSSTIIGNKLEQDVCLQEGCYDFVITNAFNGGGCNEPAWNSGTVYSGDAGLGNGNGEVVSYNGKLYRAQWWTQGNEPDSGGPWLQVGDCNVTYDSDLYGFAEEGEAAYFETTVASYNTPKTNAFCFGSNLVVDFAADATSIQNCESVVFTANITGGNPTAYNWSFGAGAVPATANGAGPHTVQYTDAGSKTVALTVNAVNESKSNFITVSADANNDLTAAINLNNTPSCANDQAIFTAVLSNQSQSVEYSWRVNGVQVGTEADFESNNLSNNDVVSLMVFGGDLCSNIDSILSNSITMQLTDLKTPTIDISIADGEEWPICMGGSIVMEAAAVNDGGAGLISWKVNGNDVAVGETYEFDGNNGDEVYAVLNSSMECLAINGVSSDTIITAVDLCTFTNQAELVELTVYPNPVVDVLNVKGSSIKTLEVTEVNGKLVKRAVPTNNTTEVDLSTLAPGSYVLKVFYNSGKEEVVEFKKL